MSVALGGSPSEQHSGEGTEDERWNHRSSGSQSSQASGLSRERKPHSAAGEDRGCGAASTVIWPFAKLKTQAQEIAAKPLLTQTLEKPMDVHTEERAVLPTLVFVRAPHWKEANCAS